MTMTEYEGITPTTPEPEEPLRYFCRFTFGQFFTLLMLEILTLVFVFYLGARFGNRYLRTEAAPAALANPHVIEVTAGNANPLGHAAVKADSELVDMARQIMAEEEKGSLTNRVRELTDPKPGSGTQPPSNLPPPLPNGSAESHLVIPDSLPPSQLPASAGTPPAPPPAVVETTLTGTNPAYPGSLPYSLQVGAYQDIKEASYWVEDWHRKGYNAFMIIADIPEKGRWYRVRLGGFADNAAAETFLTQFKRKESIEAIVVRNMN